MTLRLRVSRNGYLVLPKAVREAVGLEEAMKWSSRSETGYCLSQLGGWT